MIKFAPNFITILVCNDIPECDKMDNAISKRLRCINFPTEFVDGVPKGKNQKKTNQKINILFDEWRQDMMLILIEHYKAYENNESLMEPTKNILQWTNQYREDTDIYLSFLNECTELSETHVKSTDLYSAFKIWYPRDDLMPTLRNFSISLKRHIQIVSIRDGNKTTSGVKNLGLIPIDPDAIKGMRITRAHDMVAVRATCRGVDGVCPYDSKHGSEKYDNFCKHCFCNIFPNDPRTKNIRTKSKENEVINYVCMNHQGTWYHDKPIYVNYDNECCPSRRRIDLRQLIGNTMLCIEVDENQHKYYVAYDEFVRYNEIVLQFTCKYIFIRYNPDKYKVNGNVMYVDTKTRLKRLSEEIRKQIDIIELTKNEDYLKIIHLFYDE
jgi:hypothetical protein